MSNVTLSISRVHNSSVSLFIDENLIFHIENERLSHIKYDSFPFLAISKITDYTDHVDNLLICGVSKNVPAESFTENNIYIEYIRGLGRSFYNNEIKVYDLWQEHHKLHSALAFYNSGFDSALCIIKDGMGSDYYLGNDKNFTNDTFGRENGTAFLASYPNNFKEVSKSILVNFDVPNNVFYINKDKFVSNSFSEGLAFQKTAKAFGFHELDAGKVMGMSSYGKNKKYEIIKDGLINTDLFKFKGNDLRNGYLNLSFKSFDEMIDFSYDLQHQIQESILNEILYLLDKTGEKNICLSGGFFLNCVANYYILKNLPKDINIYVEPISSDAGTSIGAAKLFFHSKREFKEKRISTIYNGIDHGYNEELILSKINKNSILHVSYSDVASLLKDRNIVAIYQGRSESGPRALGNRSILYDPTDSKGRDRINSVKKREWFRPFAGTVLAEYAKEWFDLDRLDSSPFMMFAVDVVEDKKNIIPAITHVDGTCRVQTIDISQNIHYYNLILEFYKVSGVPILFNTSFNLAGDTMVETIDDAIRTLNNSDIDYLYLPEFNILIK